MGSSTTWVNTSLELNNDKRKNINNHHHRFFEFLDEDPKREVVADMLSLQGHQIKEEVVADMLPLRGHPFKEEVTEDTFVGEHNVGAKQENGALVEELNRMNKENRMLMETITVLHSKYTTLQDQFTDLVSKNNKKDQAAASAPPPPRKRKLLDSEEHSNLINHCSGNSDTSSSDEDSSKTPKESIKNTKVSSVHYRIDANDSNLVKDGYQWRKYGQKVTRDNPSPRAYFKCSFAPACPVKKKVQRSAEDPSVVVATYEGEHNHAKPCQPGLSLGSSQSSSRSNPIPTPTTPARPSSLGPISGPDHDGATGSTREVDQSPAIKQILIQQMASSLTRDPNFTAALAAAISGSVFNQTRI